MPNYNFWKDLPIAQKTEKQVAKILSSNGAEILSFNNDNRYDIKIKWKNGKTYTIEVKEDFACQQTGNVGVEFSCRGKKSGISSSEADFYIYKIHEPTGDIHIYMMKTEDLKKLIENKIYHRIVNGGDPGSNSMNYLFLLNYIQEISTILK